MVRYLGECRGLIPHWLCSYRNLAQNLPFQKRITRRVSCAVGGVLSGSELTPQNRAATARLGRKTQWSREIRQCSARCGTDAVRRVDAAATAVASQRAFYSFSSIFDAVKVWRGTGVPYGVWYATAYLALHFTSPTHNCVPSNYSWASFALYFLYIIRVRLRSGLIGGSRSVLLLEM